MNGCVSYERLHDVLDYDPSTGVFTWKITKGSRAISGRKAGSVNIKHGYVEMCIDGNRYYAHRLSWFFVHGYWPENEIDHINRIRNDNRLFNLREVSRQCNSINCSAQINNQSGVKGVYWRKDISKWMVQIKINYKNKYVGYFEDFDEAACHRLAAEQCLGWSGCDSNSEAYIYVKNIIGGNKE